MPKTSIPVLKVDGGAAKNSYLMQFQANILGIAIALAKLGNHCFRSGLPSRSDCRLWKDLEELKISSWAAQIFEPVNLVKERLYKGGRMAVRL